MKKKMAEGPFPWLDFPPKPPTPVPNRSEANGPTAARVWWWGCAKQGAGGGGGRKFPLRKGQERERRGETPSDP